MAFEGYLSRRHSISKQIVHMVFTAKFRCKIIDEMMIQLIRKNSKAQRKAGNRNS